MSINVVLADDHNVLRAGLAALLNSEPDIFVVGEADNGRDAIRVTESLTPDVAVIDISMPELNGIESVRVLRQRLPAVRLIVLSMHANQDYIMKAFQAGANGYVLKSDDAGEVIAAIRAVIAKGSYLSEAIKTLVGDMTPQELSQTLDAPRLTTREREVVQLIAEGLSTREIGEHLFISVKTVETHRTNIMRKLDTRSAADIVKYAIKHGMVSLDDF